MKSLIFRRLPADNELNASSCKFGDESNEISNPLPPKTKFLKVVYLSCPPGGGRGGGLQDVLGGDVLLGPWNP